MNTEHGLGSARTSIEAYDDTTRASTYDRQMDLMHPLRHKMAAIVTQVLPVDPDAEFRALELGSGSGFFTSRFLTAFPRATVVAIDGAPAMMETARTQLADVADRIDCRQADVRDLGCALGTAERFQIVYSAYTLHHLDAPEKRAVLTECAARLETGGWFVNADLVAAGSAFLGARYQDLRVRGILQRADPDDPVFGDEDRLRDHLARMERSEGDQPQTLETDLKILTSAGLRYAAVHWLEYREAVTGGIR